MTTVRIPLLHDRHTHISFYAALGAAVDLSACVTLPAAMALLKARRPPLLLASGWKNNYYDIPPAELDKLGPAVVCNVSLHSFRVNAAARKLLAGKFPEIIARIGDQDWVERHLPQVFGLFTAGGAGSVPAYMARLAALGIWAAGDMLVPSDKAALLLAGKYKGRATLWAEPARYKEFGAAARAAVSGLKIFTDGALGARTAALKGRYKGGGKGILLRSDAELGRLFREAAALTGAVAVHAIGDAALEQVLTVLEKAAPERSLAVRIEHAQLITLQQARRAKKLGVKLCMQPNFSSDSVFYADRLPAKYLRANNPFRMLIDKAGFVPGTDLVFGSDGMPHGARAALEEALFPPFAGQRLTLQEFKAGYCLPDLGPGWIDVKIDQRARKVNVKVKLAGRRL
jgi:predicted amidohydrolase YtcJ